MPAFVEENREQAAIAGEARARAESRAGAVVVEARPLRDPLPAFWLSFRSSSGRSVTPSGRESIAPSTVSPPQPMIQTPVRDDSGCVTPTAASNDCAPVAKASLL